MAQEDRSAQILEQYKVIRDAVARLQELGEHVSSHGHGSIWVHLEGDTFTMQDEEILDSKTYRPVE